jgi:hypothetical protein
MKNNKKSAIQQAVEMLDRIINLKINKPPLPKSQVKQYSVATLPGGLLLRSMGMTKMSPATKKVKQAKEAAKESTAPIGEKGNVGQTIADLLLQIAVPSNQMGTAQNRAFALANYVNNILRPRMASAPGISAPALLPDAAATQKLYQPSAITNLPPLVQRMDATFVSPLSKYKTFMENTEKVQKEMAAKILAQLTRGERPAAYGALGGLGRAPLTSGYEADSYRLPAPKTATTSTIRPQTPTVGVAMIR